MPVAPRSSGWLALAADSMPAGCPYPVAVPSDDPIPIEPTGGFASSDSLETEIEFGPTTFTRAASHRDPLWTELGRACS
jgi:hypothetical protein